MDVLGLDIELIAHDCFCVKNSQTIYFDPYQLPEGKLEKADLILVSHEHFDHCSTKDLQKISDKNTTIVASEQCQSILNPLKNQVKKINYLKPGQGLDVSGIKIEAVPAYNVDKFRSPGIPFHPKFDNKCGYVVTVDGKRLYHAGDSDFIQEMRTLKNIDIAFLPVSGTYVMTAHEAADAAMVMKPRVAIPMHYGTIIGSRDDAESFKFVAKGVNVLILK